MPTTSRTTFPFRHKRGNRLALSVMAQSLALAFAAPAIANPLGSVVINGMASLAPSSGGKALTVTNSPGAILNWNSFSIGAGESVRFVQKNVSSQVLNRVVGSDPSQILGTLNSNGKVFLINPNGIAFGAGSQVNVAGLVASTLNLSDADFLAGSLRFQATPGAGKLSNQGTIQAANGGQIYLVGSAIDNGGLLTAPNGDVILAAGKTVNLIDARNPEITVEINAPANQAVNLGQIMARNISMLAGAIMHSGSINADAAVIGDGGRIWLKAFNNVNLDTGSLVIADGTAGGFIDVKAGKIAVLGGRISADGNAGQGGQVNVQADEIL